MFNKEKYSEELADCLRELATEARRIAASDNKVLRHLLKPGETMPPENVLKTEAGRREAFEALTSAYKRIEEASKRAEDEAMREMAEPMSAEAASYIGALKARDHVTSDEIEAGFRAYGQNWTAYRELSELNNKALLDGIMPSSAHGTYTHPLEGATDYIAEEARNACELVRICIGNDKLDPDGMMLRLSFAGYVSRHGAFDDE